MLSVSSPISSLLAALDCKVARKAPAGEEAAPELPAFADLLTALPAMPGLPGLDFAPEGESPPSSGDTDGDELPETGNFLPLTLPVLPLAMSFAPPVELRGEQLTSAATASAQPPAQASLPVTSAGFQPAALPDQPESPVAPPVSQIERTAIPVLPAEATADVASTGRRDSTPQTKVLPKAIQIAVRDAAPAQQSVTSEAVEQSADSAPAPLRMEAHPQRAPADLRSIQPDSIAPVELTSTETPARSHHVAVPAPAHSGVPATDIGAALDRLVAAREALMPSHTAVEVEHTEFGSVSIRFDQSATGQLSVELSAADPDLRRAVAASAPADFTSANNTDSSAGRQSGPQRDGLSDRAAGNSTGGDGRPHGERASQDRRGQPTPQPRHAQTEYRSGTFA